MIVTAGSLGVLAWGLIALLKPILPSDVEARLNRFWPLIAVGLAVGLAFAGQDVLGALAGAVGQAPPEAPGPGGVAEAGALAGAVSVLLHAVVHKTGRGK